MAQTACAQTHLRPLAPAPPTHPSASPSIHQSFSFRALRPLAPSVAAQYPLPSSQKPTRSTTDLSLPHDTAPKVAEITNRSLAVSDDGSRNTSTNLIRQDSSSSTSTSQSREASSTPSTSIDKDEKSTSVQPSKEWILPARAKPGRKPSETEPPTKRKAQNRASQRAFRERKQSYVSSLEQKIEEYERRGTEMSMELQQVAKRLKEDNEQVKKENATLKERIRDLESERSKWKEDADAAKGVEVVPLRHADSLINNRSVKTRSPLEDGAPSKRSHDQSTNTNEMNMAKRKLWYTRPASLVLQTAPQVCPTEQAHRRFHTSTAASMIPIDRKPRIWPIYASSQVHQHLLHHQMPASVPIFRLRKTSPLGPRERTAACTGDPSQCGACSADPALAAFCRAVASHLSTDPKVVTPAILDAGNALPLRNDREKRSFDNEPTLIRSQSLQQPLQSIPEAWNSIRLHPSFPQWQGGLDMLADIVSKRAHASIDVDGHDSRQKITESYSRGENDDKKSEEDATGIVKKRRLFIEREGVEDALALLDHGSKQTPPGRGLISNHRGSSSSCDCPLKHTL